MASSSGFPLHLFLLVGVGVPGLFVLIGLLMVLLSGSITQLQCRRAQPQQVECDRTQRNGGLIAISEKTVSVGGLEGARVGRQQYSVSESVPPLFLQKSD